MAGLTDIRETVRATGAARSTALEIRETDRVRERAAAAIIPPREPDAPACCEPRALATCCRPEAKDGCCGSVAAADSPADCACTA